MKYLIRIVIFFFLLSCNGNEPIHIALERIDKLSDIKPRQALLALDSIRYESLTESDRHRFDLLSIKCKDKAYADISSDSLILDVIEYYADQRNTEFLPQALYYGARVYIQFGDYPQAIEFFSRALDMLPDKKENIGLRGSILSQTGRLMQDLNRQDEAINYFKQSIHNYKSITDSTGVVYDNLQLAKIYMNGRSLDLARKHLAEADLYSNSISNEAKAWIKAENASLLIREGKKDSAYMIMYPLSQLVDSLYRHYANQRPGKFHASSYGIDTSYLYAKELVFKRDFNDRVIVSQRLFPMIPKDSIQALVMEYEHLADEYSAQYVSPEELVQKTRYNYQSHVRAREKSENEKNIVIWGAVIILLFVFILFLYQKIRSIRTEMRLRMALNVIGQIEFMTQLEKDKLFFSNDNIKTDPYKRIILLPAESSSNRTLKSELLERLNHLIGDNTAAPAVDEVLMHSKEMNKMQKLLKEKKGIKQEDSMFWDDLEKSVDQSSPDFKSRLQILTDNKMTDNEYKVALLIRYGITPKEMSILFWRTKSAISDRRSSLAKKIFGPSANNASLDKLILIM